MAGPAPPDGGYGWLVVLASLLQMMTGGPIMPMYGIFFKHKFERFGMGETEQRTIFMVYLVSWNLVTMLVGPLAQLRSHRFVALCSTLCIMLGVGLSSLASCFAHMLLTYGLLCGVGMGLGNANGILILNKYFNRRVGVAFALYAIGLGVAAIAMPQLIKLLLAGFTPDHTILVYASVASTGLIGAALMKDPVPDSRLNQKTADTMKPLVKSSDTSGDLKNRKNSLDQKNIFVKMLFMIKWRLLCSPYFVTISIGNSMAFNVTQVVASSLRSITAEKGLTLSQSADLVSVGNWRSANELTRCSQHDVLNVLET